MNSFEPSAISQSRLRRATSTAACHEATQRPVIYQKCLSQIALFTFIIGIPKRFPWVTNHASLLSVLATTPTASLQRETIRPFIANSNSQNLVCNWFIAALTFTPSQDSTKKSSVWIIAIDHKYKPAVDISKNDLLCSKGLYKNCGEKGLGFLYCVYSTNRNAERLPRTNVDIWLANKGDSGIDTMKSLAIRSDSDEMLNSMGFVPSATRKPM